jgi:hypothetical protein
MFRVIVLIAFALSAMAFSPMRNARQSMALRMSSETKASKLAVAALAAASLFGTPAFANVGDAPKIGIFSNAPLSSPFTQEDREDPIYSPYSPYGDGSKAAYNARKGGKEEIAFWKNQFDNCVKRTEKVPGFQSKKQWMNINTELTSYAYNMREAMLRLADASKDPKAANAVAKAYFSDLNDIIEFSIKKNGDTVASAYAQSLKDLANFKALTK